MTHALALTSYAATGARPAVPLRAWFGRAPTAARTVRTPRGVALFDEDGRYVGFVTAVTDDTLFGRGAETVLLSR